MNDEIKEILIKDFNEILVPEFTTDWKEKRFYIQLLIETMPLINLLDYITDLQEENERLKKELNKHIKEGIEKCQIIFSALEYINDGSVFDGSGMCANDLRLLLSGIIARSGKK